MSAPRPILIFDGDCGFCTTSAGLAQRWFGLDHVEPYQFVDLDAYGLTAQQCDGAAQFVDRDGVVSSAEMAIIDAARHGNRFFRAVGWVVALPGIRQVAGVVYRWVARNRYRLPGGTPACQLPRPD